MSEEKRVKREILPFSLLQDAIRWNDEARQFHLDFKYYDEEDIKSKLSELPPK